MSRNPNRMQEATDLLKSKFEQVASVTVTYSRGTAIVITGILATVGRTVFDVVQGDMMIAHESRDYQITKAVLVSGSPAVQIIPASGDRITEADGRVYEVSVPSPLNLFEKIGPDGTVFKIHTIGPK